MLLLIKISMSVTKAHVSIPGCSTLRMLSHIVGGKTGCYSLDSIGQGQLDSYAWHLMDPMLLFPLIFSSFPEFYESL